MGTGWGLTARLVSQHFSSLGDSVAQAIAAFDPEVATQADRDQLEDKLRQTAVKLAQAREAFNKEHRDVVNLMKLIESDTNALKTINERLAAGTISESSVSHFLDELEANKAKLPQEQQEEESAKSYMDQLQQLVDSISDSLQKFDDRAKKAKQDLANAQAQIELNQLQQQRQAELNDLANLKSNSTALDALAKKASKLQSQAAGMKIVTDINQKTIDQADEINQIRQSATNGDTESTADRMKRLMGTAA